MKMLHETLERLRDEADRLKDFKTLKKEAIRIGQDLMNINLTAEARKNLESLEKHYHDLVKNFSSTQKLVEKELVKARKVLRSVRVDIDKQIKRAKVIATKKRAAAEQLLKKRRSSAPRTRKKTQKRRRVPANAN